MTELSSAQLPQEEGDILCANESAKKPFVEPAVSVPLDVLEATAFFQGSASLDIADI